MAVVKDKIIFCSTKLQDFSSEPIGSENFYSRYDEFVRLFAKIIPHINFEEYFAEPYFNKDTKNLDWYVPEKGGDLLRVTDLEQLDSAAFHEALHMHQVLIEDVKRARESHPANLSPFFNAVLLGLENDHYRYWRDNHLVYVVWGVKAKPGRKIEMKFSDDIINRRAYKIKYLTEGQGSLTINEIARKHNHVLQGERDIPIVTAAERYVFKTWQPFPPQGVKVVSDMTFTAVFEFDNKPQIKFKSSKGGSIQGETTLYVEQGYPLTFDDFPQAQADDGYRFEGWTPTCEFPITINDDMEFTARFSAIGDSGNNHGDSSSCSQDGLSEHSSHDSEDKSYDVLFLPGEHGTLRGQTVYTKAYKAHIVEDEVPEPIADAGYRFVKWDKNPIDHIVIGDIEFTALYEEDDTNISRINGEDTEFNNPGWWNWLKNQSGKMSGCLNSLLSLLLLGLIGLLLWFLLGNHNLNFCGCDCDGNVLVDTIPENRQEQDTTKKPAPEYLPCNELQFAGDNEPKSFIFDMGQDKGSFIFEYSTGDNLADEITIYDGPNRNNKIIYHCHETTGYCDIESSIKVPLRFSNQKILIDVIPDQSYGTCWEIKVNCPNN